MTGPSSGADGVDDHVEHRRRGRGDVVAVDRDVVDAVSRGPLLERRRVLRRTPARTRRTRCSRRRRPPGASTPRPGSPLRGTRRARPRRRRRTPPRRRRRRAAAPRSRRRPRSAGRRPRSRSRRRCRSSDRRCASSRRARGSCPASLRHQLGEHPERVETLREAVAVAAMGRRDHVGRAERPARADGRRLLPDRQVHEARESRRRGTARPRAPRTRGSRASADASRGGRRR